jgi:hypothetical protein
MKNEIAKEIYGLAKNIDIYEPVAYVILVSDGAHFQGGSSIDMLDAVDKVDLVCYLIKHLGITLEDVEEKNQLSDEIKLMKALLSDNRRLNG